MGTVLKGRVVEALQDTVKVDVSGRIIECVGRAAAGSQVILCIRPEHVTLALRNDGDSARNHFSGTIMRIIPKGHFLDVQLDCGFPLSTHITHQSCEELNLAEGGSVAATFKATAVHMIAHSE
jgi:tungstate transport system ATP-binding protein